MTPKRLNRDPQAWAKVVPDAFLDGSIVQARNVIEMATQDIAALDSERKHLEAENARLRNLLWAAGLAASPARQAR